MTLDRSMIGSELEPFSFPVERGKVREFARAIFDDSGVHLDGETPPAPLTFTRTMNIWSESFVSHILKLGIDPSRILHAGQEFEYLGPVVAGDTLTVTGRLSEIYDKEGRRGGALTFIVYEYEFTNQRGELVIRTKNVTIHTTRAPSVSKAAS